MTAGGRCPGRWHRALVLPGVLLVALFAASCSSPSSSASTTTEVTLVPHTGGTVAVGIDQAPTGCNPNTAGGDTWANNLVLAPVLPSVFTVGANGQSVVNQQLIDSAEAVNLSPLTVVYTINPKAVWADGVPINAADFMYAWHEQRGSTLTPTVPSTGAVSSLGYRDIKSVVGSNGGKTVTVVFKTPFADWSSLFANLLPAHIMEKAGWDPPCTSVDPAVDLSGGPYEIASVSPGTIVLSANPHWWGTKPSLQRIVVRVADGNAQLAGWARRGSAQVIEPTAFGPSFLLALSADAALHSEVDISSTFLQLELSASDPATGATAVREALAHAIDRQALVSSVVGFADQNIVPSESHLYVQTQSQYPSSSTSVPNPLDAAASTTTTTQPPGGTAAYPTTASPSQTTKLLESANYVLGPDGRWEDPDGKPVLLRLAVDTADPWATETATMVQHQLERAGFGVTLDDQPSATAAGTALAEGADDLALLPFVATPHQSEALAWYTPSLGPAGQNGSQNWTDLDDPMLTALLTKATQELNPVTAQPDFNQADQILWKDMVALPLFAEPTVQAWSVRLSGVTANVEGPNLLGSVAQWERQVVKPLSTTTSG